MINTNTNILSKRRGLPYPPVLNDGNTVAWYDYKKLITKDGSDFVSRWNDRLGSGHDLIQVLGSSQPLWSVNGILFNGVDEFMRSIFTLIQPEMIYIVFKQVTWANNDYLFDGALGATGIFIQPNAGSSPDLGIYAGASSPFDSSLALNTFGIARILFNGASGKLIINNETPITGNFGANDMGGMTLGGNGSPTPSIFGNLEVKEIIIRKIADGVTDEANVYNYLKNKYGL